jgi:HEAT repeat protein
MGTIQPLLIGLGMLLPMSDASTPSSADPARLKELLYDSQQPRAQTSAALLLVQLRSADSQEIIRQGLKQTDSPEVFLALSAALRAARDTAFVDELLLALARTQTPIHQSASETLGELADAAIVSRLKAVIEDRRTEPSVRQAAMGALGRSGQKSAVPALLAQLSSQDDAVRRTAADALGDLTGQSYGLDVVRWRGWWEQHKDVSEERWLAERLAFQASRSRRLEGELDRARAQILRLHQQLYTRLPAGDRLNHVQGLVEAEEPLVRGLAVNWCTELLGNADAVGQQALTEILMKLARDGNLEIQRSAVLALGRAKEPRACDQLRALLQRGPAPIRAAAARALAQQVKGTAPEVLARQRKVVPALQRALDDPDLEVVVEAAESLGTLGVPEAGAVLTVLLRHSSQPVRQTAALALERIADPSSLDGLLAALNDPAPNIRFSLVGAIGHAAGDSHTLSEAQRNQVLARLEGLMVRDADPGVRSRAATVLGECGSTSALPALWKRVLSTEDARVQEKAWEAIIEIIARSGNVDLLREWDRIIVETGQAQRRLQFLGEVSGRWQKREESKSSAALVLETLVQAQLEQGKWSAAVPIIRGLLARPADDAALDRDLQWLLCAGQQALKEGKRADALHILEEAQPFLARRTQLAPEFERLEKAAKQ